MSNQVILPKGWRSISSRRILLKNGRFIDPSLKLDTVTSLLLEDGIITSIGTSPATFDGEVIDCSGLTLTPGFFDMHVHLREPGYEHKETVKTGCASAAAGGFTGVACMPNTSPAIDNPGIVNFVRDQASGTPVDVHPIAATTKGRKGEVLSEMAELRSAGVTAFSDDGSPVASADLMRRALEYSHMLGALIIEHCEEPTMTVGGIMHECGASSRLGLGGWPAVAEEISIQRNIMLAEYTGGHLHCAHVSTAKGADLIREAKKRGVNVTGEVTPHHLTIDCAVLENYDSDFKVNPPLRTTSDAMALIEAVRDGTIDVIATDHAPHAHDEKEVELALAPFGMVGLETSVGVCYATLVASGKIDLNHLINAMSIEPRKIMRLPRVSLEVGQPSNLSIFDFAQNWTVNRDELNSKSHNTPFQGWQLTGKAVGVINRNAFWFGR